MAQDIRNAEAGSGDKDGKDRKTSPGGNVRDRDNDRAGGGGVVDDGPGADGGTLGTGGSARDQDR